MTSVSFPASLGLPELVMRPVQHPTMLAASQPSADGGFSQLLGEVAKQAATALRAGEGAALGAIQGGVPLQSVVERVMAAERTLQAALAVRDKAVTSYLEISRMQI